MNSNYCNFRKCHFWRTCHRMSQEYT